MLGAAFFTTDILAPITGEITAAGPILLGVIGMGVALRVAVKYVKRAGRV